MLLIVWVYLQLPPHSELQTQDYPHAADSVGLSSVASTQRATDPGLSSCC